jgi:hypothetical protein
MRRLLALPLWWLAVLLVVVGGLAKAFGWLDLPLGVWIGGSLIALGLNVLVGGDVVVAPHARPFSARAQVSRAVLDIVAEVADVEVRASDDYERLATVRVGPGAGPDFKVANGVAHLRLASKLPWLPGASNWQASLATNVLWDVTAHSVLGHLDVDLSHVRVDRASLKSSLGGVRVTCPRRGQPQLRLETLLGDLEVVVPREVGARVRVERGGLAHVNLDSAHFEQLDATTFATHNLESARAVGVGAGGGGDYAARPGG